MACYKPSKFHNRLNLSATNNAPLMTEKKALLDAPNLMTTLTALVAFKLVWVKALIAVDNRVTHEVFVGRTPRHAVYEQTAETIQQ